MMRFLDTIQAMTVQRIIFLMSAAASFILAAVFVGIVGLPHRADYVGSLNIEGHITAPKTNALAPDFRAVSLEGEPIHLADLLGSPVVINFWATWCAPCRAEMPILETFYREFQKDGLRVLAVNLAEPHTALSTWVKAYNLTFDILLDDDEDLAMQYWIMGPPTTFIISSQGVITHIFRGTVTLDDLRNAVGYPFKKSG